MPTDSLEHAAAWYTRNVDQVRSIGNRLSRGAPMPPAPRRDGSAALARAAALAAAAHHMLEAGAFEQIEDELRAALRAVPSEARAALKLPLDVFRELTRGVFDSIEAHKEPGDFVEGSMSPEDAEWLGAFWYQVAAGEMVLQQPNE